MEGFIMNFVLSNLELILAILCFVVLIILWFIGKKKVVKSVLLQMVIDAEAKYGSGTGNIKHNVVVGYIKQKFPTLFLIISDETLDKWIEDMVEYIKTELGEDEIQKAGGHNLAPPSDESTNQLK